MGYVSEKISNFMARYSRTNGEAWPLDLDLTQPGVQVPLSTDLASFNEDYHVLSIQEQFAAFSILRNRGDTELLKSLIGSNTTQCTADYIRKHDLGGLKERLDQLDTELKNLLTDFPSHSPEEALWRG